MTDHESIMDQFKKQEGWDDSTALKLCLEYIHNQGDSAAFRMHLEENSSQPLNSRTLASVQMCARCGKDHRNLLFYKFTNPVQADAHYTHWARCPVSCEPILMRILEAVDA